MVSCITANVSLYSTVIGSPIYFNLITFLLHQKTAEAVYFLERSCLYDYFHAVTSVCVFLNTNYKKIKQISIDSYSLTNPGTINLSP